MIHIFYLDTFIQLIHSWYPGFCCSDKDCHPIPCESLNYIIDYGLLLKSQVYQSHDALCHICTSAANINVCGFIPFVGY